MSGKMIVALAALLLTAQIAAAADGGEPAPLVSLQQDSSSSSSAPPPPPPPSSSSAPASAACDLAWNSLLTACNSASSTFFGCCAQIAIAMATTPSCFCEFTNLNVTAFYSVVGPNGCNFTVPPVVSACLTAISPPPPPSSSSSAPPPPPSSSSPRPPPPPPSSSSSNASCSLAWSAIVGACSSGASSTLSGCCSQIAIAMATTPSCFCQFTSLNVTAFYSVVGPNGCNFTVPPVVSACLSLLSPSSSPPPLALTTPPPPPSRKPLIGAGSNPLRPGFYIPLSTLLFLLLLLAPLVMPLIFLI